jgi:hypothetical protein
LPPEAADLLVVPGSTTPPGRLHRTLEGAVGGRAEAALDRLLAGTTAAAEALDGVDAGPPPPAARAIKARTGAKS